MMRSWAVRERVVSKSMRATFAVGKQASTAASIFSVPAPMSRKSACSHCGQWVGT